MISKQRLKNISAKDAPLAEAAIVELPIKLKSERRLERKLRSLFKTMGDFTLIETADKLTIPIYDVFTDDLVKILDEDSLTTSKSFKKNLRKKLQLGNIQSTRINQEIATYIAASTQKQAGYIINTTNNRVAQNALQVIEQNAMLGIELNPEEFSEQVTKKFRAGNRNRAKGIALTEVNRVAERSKMIEADILHRVGAIKRNDKRWDAILDQKTRPDHASSDGQIVPMSDPFQIGADLLMHPGDGSLGAGAAQLVNCRCSLQYITE